MTENPYHPYNSVTAVETTRISVYWKPVLIGFAIGFVGSFILAALWGIVGFIVYFSIGSTADTFYNGPVARILGWCVGIVPFAAGVIYVCRAIEDSIFANCLLVAALSVSTSIPFIFFDEDPLDWTEAVYYVVEFLVAGAIGIAWSRNTVT